MRDLITIYYAGSPYPYVILASVAEEFGLRDGQIISDKNVFYNIGIKDTQEKIRLEVLAIKLQDRGGDSPGV